MNGISPLDHGFVEPEVSLSLIPAATGKRFANWIIDKLALYIISQGLSYAFVFFELFSFRFGSGIFLFIYFAMIFFYYVVLETTFGKTVGKIVTKTHVVNIEGMKPDFMTILKRSLCRLIPFDAFSFLGKTGIGWHDSFSYTLVIDDTKN